MSVRCQYNAVFQIVPWRMSSVTIHMIWIQACSDPETTGLQRMAEQLEHLCSLSVVIDRQTVLKRQDFFATGYGDSSVSPLVCPTETSQKLFDGFPINFVQSVTLITPWLFPAPWAGWHLGLSEVSWQISDRKRMHVEEEVILSEFEVLVLHLLFSSTAF